VKLIILNAAMAELAEARDYYLEHATPGIASAFIDEFERTVDRLLDDSLLGTPITPRQRNLPLRHFPYSIIYQLAPDVLVINAIADQRRPGYWAGR
jgi:plasmid stabilization system protein ParE